MQKKICAVYGEGTVTDWMCQKWFAKFCAGDFSLYDAPWSGRPFEVDSKQVKTLIENSQWYTTGEIANILKISKLTFENHLHQLGYANCFDVWVPHKLREKNLLDHISTCDSLLNHKKIVLFLKQIVTGNEKWILYNNVEWKRSWGKRNEPPQTTPKTCLHPKKNIYMLCIWWEWQSSIMTSFQKTNRPCHIHLYSYISCTICL